MRKKNKIKVNLADPWIAGAFYHAGQLFGSIAEKHGYAIAREIFQFHAKPDEAAEAEWRNWQILHRYDLLPGDPPNIMDLVRQLSDEGLGTIATVEHRVRDLIRKRKRAMADGTWPSHAPPWPVAEDGTVGFRK